MQILDPILKVITILTKEKADAVASVNNANGDDGDVYKVSARDHGFVVSLYDADGYVGTF